MSAAVNSIIGAQSDSIGRGAGGSEFGKESGSLESQAVQSAGLAFGSIAFGIASPEVTSNRSSLIGAIGSELGVGTDVRTPTQCHIDLACNTSYHFAASCTVFPRVSPYLCPGPFAPFGTRI